MFKLYVPNGFYLLGNMLSILYEVLEKGAFLSYNLDVLLNK